MTDNQLVNLLRLNAACGDYECNVCPMPHRENGERECVHFERVVLPVAADRIEQLARDNNTLRNELCRTLRQLQGSP